MLTADSLPYERLYFWLDNKVKQNEGRCHGPKLLCVFFVRLHLLVHLSFTWGMFTI